jgi:replicative DNA helicase
VNARAETPLPERINIEAEQAVLGAILLHNGAYDAVSRILDPEHFGEPLHRDIYAVVRKMLAAGRAVTPVLIKGYLPADAKIGDLTLPQYLAKLAVESVPAFLARDNALAVHDCWIARCAAESARDVLRIVETLEPGEDPLAAFEPLEERLATLRAERLRGESSGIGRSYLESMTAADQRGDVPGVPICLPEIEQVLSEPCFEAGNLYGLLSSSGEGKTALTMQIIRHAVEHGHPVQFQSFDQSRQQCARQMVAQRHGIEVRRQRNPRLLSEKEWELCVDFSRWVDAQPFRIDKCTDQGAAQLVGMARTFVRRHGNGKVPLIVTDHIGSITPEDKRADEGTKAKGINKVLKAGAETVGAAWLVLNQRSSLGLKRDNPRPICADVFGGDPAVQAYDALFYVYRFLKHYEERKAVASSDADWKKIEKVFPASVRDEKQDIAEIGAVKVRFGSPHIRARLIFDAPLTRYRSERHDPQEELL